MRLIIAGILTVVSVVAIIVIAVYRNKDDDVTEVQGRFGIVLDAGGSGTRMSVYEYSTETKKLNEIKYMKCERKGLSTYTADKSPLLPALKNCLKEAAKEIPITVTSDTPLYMGATAGMRVLREKNETAYAQVWSTVRDILQNGSFPVKMTRTLLGNEEGGYSWSTINTLLGRSAEDSSGLYEVGSTSFQIAFEPHSTSSKVPDAYKQTVVLNEQKYDVYAHSYLCFGKSEFVRRYKANLIKDSNFSLVEIYKCDGKTGQTNVKQICDVLLEKGTSQDIDVKNQNANYAASVIDPCSYNGYRENVTSSYLFQPPCVSGDFAKKTFGESITGKAGQTYTIIGTGNFSQCYMKVEPLFNRTNCDKDCGINGVYQPDTNTPFTAIGGGVWHSSQFSKIKPKTNLANFKAASEKFCETPFSEVEKMEGYSKWSTSYCLDDVHNYFLMKTVLNLKDNDPITLADEINDERLTWSIGFMLTHVKEMSPAIMKRTKELADKAYYPLIIVFSVLLVLSLIAIVVTCVQNKRSKNHMRV